MTKVKAKKYIVVYDDGIQDEPNIQVDVLTAAQIKDLLLQGVIRSTEYAIIDGTLLKGFYNKSFDLSKLT